MTNIADERTRERITIRVDHAVAVTVRMPTPQERDRGYPDAPVLVVTGWGSAEKVFPPWVELIFDDPHGQPEPGEVAAAAAYVLGTISEELANVRATVKSLAGAFGGPPCRVTELAAEVREERAAEWYCADADMCTQARPAVSGPLEMTP